MLTEAEAGGAIIRWTEGPAINAFVAAFSPWGVKPCSQSPICWRHGFDTYYGAHRTGDNVIWITSQHFAWWTPDTCQRMWRVRYRGRVEKGGALTDAYGCSVTSIVLAEAVTKISGSC